MSDQIWMDVLPSLRNFGPRLVRDATRSARSAGDTAGAEYSKAFERSSGNAAQAKVDELESAQKSASGLVSKLSGEVSKARQAQQRSAAQLLTAEQALADAVAKHGEDSNQAKAAALRVEAARGKAADASDRYTRAEDALRDAQRASKETTEQLEAAQSSLQDEMGKAPGLWGRLKNAIQDSDGAADSARKTLGHLKGAALIGGAAIAAGVAAIGAGVATVGAIGLKGGIERALNIEDARASLTGLGHDLQDVDAIMDNALDAVRGTAFGLDEAATVAATAVAAGVQPGKELENTLRLTANTASLARVGIDEMGSVLNKVWTRGRVSTQELNQIADRGIGIWATLAEHYGVNQAELEKMVSDGKVDAETFADVLEGTVGNAAEEMGKTTRGAWRNMMAALNRGGEGFVKNMMPMIASGISGITDLFDELAPIAEAAGQKVGQWISGTVVPAFESFSAWLISDGIPALRDFGSWVGDEVVPRVESMAQTVGDFLLPKAEAFGSFLMNTAIPALRDFGGWVVDNKDWILALAVGVGGAIAAYKLWGLAVLTVRGAAAAAAGAQMLWNKAMALNPIGVIALAVAGLAAGLTYFFTQTETGQRLWGQFTTALADGWEWASSAVVSLWENRLQPALEAVGAFAVGIWTNQIQPAWEGLKAGWRGVVTGVQWGWQSLLQPTFQAVGGAAVWLYENIAKPYFNFVVGAWRVLGSVFSWVWSGVIQPVFTLVGDIVRWLAVTVAVPLFQSIGAGFRALGSMFAGIYASVIQPVFRFAGAIITWLWQNVARPYFQGLGAAFSGMGRWLSDVWTNTIRPMIRAFGDFVISLYTDNVRPGLDWISDRWSWLTGTISDFWTNKIRPILSAFGGFIKDDVPGMVDDGVSKIDRGWRKVANFFRTPINGVIDFVWNDGIAAMFNSVADAVNSDAKMAKIPHIPEFAKGGYHRGGWALVGEEGPELIDTRTPGRVYTAKETADALSLAQNHTDAPHDPRSLAGLPIGGGGNWLTRSANWAAGRIGDGARWVGDRAASAFDWVRGRLADTAERFIEPFLDGVTDFASGFGPLGQLGGDLIGWGADQVLDWIRGKDADEYGGTFEANPGGFNRPASGPITSWAGPRNIAQGYSNYHHGVDIGAPAGAAVRAAFDGLVRSAGWGPGNLGNTIVLNHGGFETAYAHLSGMSVSPGQSVTGGDRIGSVGGTGGNFAPHLHFERHRPRFYNPVEVNSLFGAGGARAVGNGLVMYDQGGVLMPGVTHTVNKTRKPEAVLTSPQWELAEEALRLAGGLGGEPMEVTQNNYMSQSQYRDAQDLKKAMRSARKKRAKAGVR